MIEPDYRRWTPEAIRAFLASEAAQLEGLTADDLKLYVAMCEAYRAAFSSTPPKGEADRKRRAELYAEFRKARFKWAAVITRLHPPPRVADVVQSLSQPEDHHG